MVYDNPHITVYNWAVESPIYTKQPGVFHCSIGGLGWCFGILGVPRSNNPFHKGIPGIQTTS